MSDPKWTPGPWGIERTDNRNWVGPMRTSGDGKIKIIVVDTIRDGLTDEARERNDANAHLISHAPEMFEALKWALSEYRWECDDPNCLDDPCQLCKARAIVREIEEETK